MPSPICDVRRDAPGRLQHRAAREAQVAAHRLGRLLGIACLQRGEDVFHAAQHRLLPLRVAEGEELERAHVVGVELDHAHQPGVAGEREPGGAEAAVRGDEALRIAARVRAVGFLERLAHLVHALLAVVALRRLAQGFGLQEQAQLVDVLQVALRERRHGEAAAVRLDQPLAREAPERLAHRRARHAQAGGERRLAQRFSPAHLSGAQVFAQQLVHPLAQRGGALDARQELLHACSLKSLTLSHCSRLLTWPIRAASCQDEKARLLRAAQALNFASICAALSGAAGEPGMAALVRSRRAPPRSLTRTDCGTSAFASTTPLSASTWTRSASPATSARARAGFSKSSSATAPRASATATP
jgi:hypothetical protein